MFWNTRSKTLPKTVNVQSMDINEFINKIEENIIVEKNFSKKDLVKFLINKYQNLDKSIVLLKLEVIDCNHFITLKFEDFYFELDFNDDNIHIIINSCEIIYFFDDSVFLKNYTKIINSLFQGDYYIVEFSPYSDRLYYLDDVKKMEEDLNKTKKRDLCKLIKGKELII
ncbi:hypothetical protein HYN48_04670 [Flavobacterium magnum]|uniref:Uncharacterized protein n=1 Tax=Flavobacterium magnum TaxID=2162713 RepID=A0A2S0RCM3_9FLAO|nr:hypothetical protein [Flavobacterium magnum]AWA29436.1 hypothetical protein HYN48_04670 [Flavobacterium magnum]